MQTPVIVVVPPTDHSVTIRIDCSFSCPMKGKVVPSVPLGKCYDSYVTLLDSKQSIRVWSIFQVIMVFA